MISMHALSTLATLATMFMILLSSVLCVGSDHLHNLIAASHTSTTPRSERYLRATYSRQQLITTAVSLITESIQSNGYSFTSDLSIENTLVNTDPMSEAMHWRSLGSTQRLPTKLIVAYLSNTLFCSPFQSVLDLSSSITDFSVEAKINSMVYRNSCPGTCASIFLNLPCP